MQQLKILVVDDDREVCEYLEAVLFQAGYLVSCIHDPTLVIRELRRTDYHVIFLDLVMPLLSGIELLTDIRQIDSDIAVILLTGHPSVDSATDSIALGANAYLTKPIAAQDLQDTLKRVARKKGLLHSREATLHSIIGQTIRGLRKSNRRTLSYLAQRTGLSVSLLSQVERAESSASMATLLKIANALKVKVSDLFGDY